MDEGFNVTYIIIGGHIELEKYRYLYFVIILTVYFLIISCNSTILCLIWTHRNLHEPMYIFIGALLINSVIWSSVIYPKLLIDFLSEEQTISYSACVLQFYMYYSLGASEFLLLSAMAYDRYVSICKPLQYPTIMSKSAISILLILAWTIPSSQIAVVAGLITNTQLCSFTIRNIFCNNTIYKLQCILSRAQIIRYLFILVTVLFMPAFFIIFSYTHIFRISYRSSQAVRKKAAQTCVPHLITLTSYSCLCVFDVMAIRLDSDFPKTLRLIMTLQLIMYHPLLNPIIYGLKMKEISKHLKRLFTRSKQC